LPVDDKASEKCASVFQCRLINDDGRSFSFDPLHDSLDGRVAEVVGIAFHRQAVDAVAEGRIVAVRADAGIEADAADDIAAA